MSTPVITDATRGIQEAPSLELDEKENRGSPPPPLTQVVAGVLSEMNHPKATQVMSLELAPHQAPPRTTEPEEFFASFNVKDRRGVFRPADVEELLRIFPRHRLSNTLTLYDLFGLEMQRTLHSLDGFMPPKAKDQFCNEWSAIYAKLYLQMLRAAMSEEADSGIPPSTEPINESCRNTIRALNAFTEKLKKGIEGRRAERAKELSPSVLEAENRRYEGLAPILARWDTSTGLLNRFLIHKEAKALLTETTLHCPGSNQAQPAGREQALEALPNLERYLSLMSRSVRAAAGQGVNVGPFYALVEDLQKAARSLNPKSPSIAEDCTEYLKRIIQAEEAVNVASAEISARIERIATQWDNQSKLIAKSPSASKSKLKELEAAMEMAIQELTLSSLMRVWILDLRTILEHSLLTHLDPRYVNTLAYSNRMYMNLVTLLGTVSQDPPASEGSPLETQLQALHAAFNGYFCSQPALLAIQQLMDLNQKYACPPYFLMTSHLEELHAALTPLVGQTLHTLASAHPSGLTDPGSALQATLWFSRILVLYNDISVILGKKDCRDELLPQEFLDFLSGLPASPHSDSDLSEDDTVQSSSPPPPLLPPHPELQPIRPPSPTHVADHKVSLDAAQPALEVENKGASAVEKCVIIPAPNPPPSPKRETPSPVVHSAPPSSRERKARAEARDLLNATKTRHVIAILEQLGLAPIRQRGSHIVYEHPETKAQTVVPNHPSIKRGTLQSIFNQVTGKKK